VRAVNRGALASHEDEEARAAEVWVSYKAPRELPPRFAGLRLEPEPEVKRLDGKEVWVVNRPAVRLIGRVEAEGLLVQADWSAGGAPNSLLPEREGRVAEFAANLKLKDDEMVPVRIRLRAKSKHSDVKTEDRYVVFHPPLPTVSVDPLQSEDVLAEKVTLTGTFQAATRHAFGARFRVTSPEGKVKSFLPKVDRAAAKWKAELSLFPARNTIQAFVSNEWRGEQALEEKLNLYYRRPPRITEFPKQVEAVETNKLKLTVMVEGPADRPLTAFQVDRQRVDFKAGEPEKQGDRWVWKVDLPEVFVNDGDRNLDRLSLQAITSEGESEAAVVRVVHKKKLLRLPRGRFINPAVADTVRRPSYTVTFRVESERPLQRVEILGGRKPHQADLKKVERDGALYVLQEEALLTLNSGANVLELVAVNAEGRSPRAEVVVSYTPPAVLVSIDRVELLANNGKLEQVLEPDPQPNGDVTFPTAPRSLVWLVGQVRWSDPAAKALDRDLQVVAKVGDCRQFPVELGPRGKGDQANVRPFRVPMVLIGPRNRIKVEVPSVGQQELSRREFTLACAAPAKNQRLHVLIVGVNVKDSAGLKKRLLDALAVDAKDRPRGPQGEFSKNPPFEQCILYHVLAGEVDRSNIEGQLVEINNEIKRLAEYTGWLNDVVLIYYQGEDVVVPGKKERWLKTSRNLQFPTLPPQKFAVPCHDLPRALGAQVLLLNVAGTPDSRPAGPDWGGDPSTGFLRYVCHDPVEASSADPTLLGMLEKAIRKKARLGEVVQQVNELLLQEPKKYGRLVKHLDEDHEKRQFSALDR
jgi:hypothetical protein